VTQIPEPSFSPSEIARCAELSGNQNQERIQCCSRKVRYAPGQISTSVIMKFCVLVKTFNSAVALKSRTSAYGNFHSPETKRQLTARFLEQQYSNSKSWRQKERADQEECVNSSQLELSCDQCPHR
jgi:hypothetical protein